MGSLLSSVRNYYRKIITIYILNLLDFFLVFIENILYVFKTEQFEESINLKKIIGFCVIPEKQLSNVDNVRYFCDKKKSI